jgi:molecular chaperone GrpE
MTKNQHEKHEAETEQDNTCPGCPKSSEEEGSCKGCHEEEIDSDLAVVMRALDKMRNERDEMVQAAKRLQADFENYKRRNASVRSDAYDEGVADALIPILPVLDNFERALCTADEGGEGGTLMEGMNLIYRQMTDATRKLGLEEIPALGEDFDHDLHNAVMQAEAGEEHEPGKVCEVFQKGYQYKGRVLRHSMVKVAK